MSTTQMDRAFCKENPLEDAKVFSYLLDLTLVRWNLSLSLKANSPQLLFILLNFGHHKFGQLV